MPSTPRIAPVDPATTSERTQELLGTTRGLNGEGVLNIFATLAHHPRALRHSLALGGAFLFAGNIDDRTREIVILRVAHHTGSEYEYGQHFVIGQRCGLSADDCRGLLADAPPPSFSDLERTVVTAVDELCAHDVVTDETWALLAVEFDDRQLVELVMLAGYYRMLAGFLNSAGVQLDNGLTGFDS